MPSHTPTRKYHSQKKEKNNKFNLGYSTTEEIENSLLTFSIFKEYSPFFSSVIQFDENRFAFGLTRNSYLFEFSIGVKS